MEQAVTRKKGIDRSLRKFGVRSGTKVVSNTPTVDRLPRKRLKAQFE